MQTAESASVPDEQPLLKHARISVSDMSAIDSTPEESSNDVNSENEADDNSIYEDDVNVCVKSTAPCSFPTNQQYMTALQVRLSRRESAIVVAYLELTPLEMCLRDRSDIRNVLAAGNDLDDVVAFISRVNPKLHALDGRPGWLVDPASFAMDVPLSSAQCGIYWRYIQRTVGDLPAYVALLERMPLLVERGRHALLATVKKIIKAANHLPAAQPVFISYIGCTKNTLEFRLNQETNRSRSASATMLNLQATLNTFLLSGNVQDICVAHGASSQQMINLLEGAIAHGANIHRETGVNRAQCGKGIGAADRCMDVDGVERRNCYGFDSICSIKRQPMVNFSLRKGELPTCDACKRSREQQRHVITQAEKGRIVTIHVTSHTEKRNLVAKGVSKCSNCLEEKPLDQFTLREDRELYESKCHECVRVKQKLDRHIARGHESSQSRNKSLALTGLRWCAMGQHVAPIDTFRLKKRGNRTVTNGSCQRHECERKRQAYYDATQV